MPSPSVFISYSHKDEEWKDRLVTHLGVLEQAGILDLWEDRRIEAGDDWKPEIEEAINKATVAILMISANFLTSKFILVEEVPKLLERREKEGVRVIPLIVKPCAWTQVKWLSKIQARPKDGKPLSGGNENQIDADLAAIADEIAKLLKRAESTPTKSYAVLGPDKVSTAKLPSTDPTLFGRELELIALNDAWNNQEINVLSLVAWGGVGKSALVNKWLLQMAKDNYRGAERAYGWSFYSQGAAEGRQVSADQFIAAALEWFGDPDVTKGSPWDKGERLAELIKQQRTLLILDGLEPLQNPPSVETGKIKDPGLTSLLRELARQNPGLVIITTRLTVDDLKDFKDNTTIEIDLENLSPEAGADYLKYLGVDGTDDERKDAAKDFAGHALALTLMGSYLKVVHHGDIRKRREIPLVLDERKQGAHARRVMESYERWLESKPELDILRLMGLFDRPAEKEALDALREEPVIEGLTNNIQSLSHVDWQYAVQNLRDLRLIAQEDPHEPNTLDCHPLLREHFGEKLKASNPDAWREAHGRLYEYYKSIAKEFPDTLEEMVPLYAAMMHACQAGQHQESLSEVYLARIQRGDEYFNSRRLGAIGAELVVLSAFFDPPWSQPIATLSEDAKGFVLNEASLDLRAVGRLAEAVQPIQSAVNLVIEEKDWQNAAVGASNLSELYLTIGDLRQALNYARNSIELADRSDNMMWKMASRTTLADALHQEDRLSEAEAAFREAEEMQKRRQPMFPLLYAVQGYQYCDLLLSEWKVQEVKRRAGQTLEWAKQAGGSLIAIAVDYLSLGRALTLTLHFPYMGEGVEASTYLNHAVDGLRQAGVQDYVVRGLLTRMEFYRVTGALDNAQKDLDEAFTIVTRGGMRLYEADCHLEYARWYLAKGDKVKAREHWEIAKKMIEAMGYHRRDKEVQELEEQLK